MRRVILFLLLVRIPLINNGQIIADHTIVDRYDDIPTYYMDLVKTMWLNMAGESHRYAYQEGLQLLEALNSNYPVYVTSDPSGSGGAGHIAYAGGLWGDYDNATGWIGAHGEEDWFTNATAVSRIKAHLLYCKNEGYTVSALGFGWCYDADAGLIADNPDPVYGVHWSGQSVHGPEGNLEWGLDAADFSLTGNSVCMDTYITKTQEFIDYCTANSINTKVFFTTGPVDSYVNSEAGYQAYLKWEHLRNYVKADPTRILFDYADILCWDNDGTPATNTWNGHTYPHITAANLENGTHAHIGETGELRIGKALWWMLARIAGWDGN